MILSNNDRALEAVRHMSASEIRAKIEDAGLLTYGYEAVPVAKALGNARDIKTVVGSLDNSDTDGMLEIIAQRNPAGIVAGLAAIVKVVGAGNALLQLPNTEDAAAFTDLAARAGLKLAVETGDMVDVREHANDLLLHIETLAAIADVLTGESFGTVVASGDGQPQEVPFGTKLEDVVGTENVKALLINGRFYDASVLQEPLTPAFAIGSGRIAVYSDSDCMASATEKTLLEMRKKSCGKCTFCREGLFQLDTIFTDITQDRAKESDLALAEEISEAMEFSTLCSVGKRASWPVRSSLAGFRDEVVSHIKKKSCPAGTCTAFTTFYIDPSKCKGCGDCIDICPEDCIEGKASYISMIDKFGCSKCGKCLEVCPNGAIQRTSGRLPRLPERLTRVGRFSRR